MHAIECYYVYSIAQDDHYYYGIGQNVSGWKRLTRDIVVDLQKGIQASVAGDKKKKHRRTELKVSTIHNVLM